MNCPSVLRVALSVPLMRRRAESAMLTKESARMVGVFMAFSFTIVPLPAF